MDRARDERRGCVQGLWMTRCGVGQANCCNGRAGGQQCVGERLCELWRRQDAAASDGVQNCDSRRRVISDQSSDKVPIHRASCPFGASWSQLSQIQSRMGKRRKTVRRRGYVTE